MKSTRYRDLATAISAMRNCIKTGNTEWEERWGDRIDQIMETAPSGSGIDSGTKLEIERCSDQRLVFSASYHHMNDSGYYDGWTEHTITARASLQFGFDLAISGRDRNEIKDYLVDTYHYWLSQETDDGK